MARKKAKNVNGEAEQAVDGLMAALVEIGAVDMVTMKEYKALDTKLTATLHYTGTRIKNLRNREHASQAVFADFCGVTVGLISKWERNEKKPNKMAMRLLQIIERNGMWA